MNQFPTTAWTLLRDARNLPENQGVKCRNEFFRRYWKPVYTYILVKDVERLHARAEDLTQAFLVRVIEKDLLAKADSERGRFRNFFRKNLDWFLADQSAERATRQEAFENRIVPGGNLSDQFARDGKPRDVAKQPVPSGRQQDVPNPLVQVADLLREEDWEEPPPNSSPDYLFWNQWAKVLVNRVLRSTEQRCKDNARPDWWYRVFAAMYDESQRRIPSEERLARDFGRTREEVRYALQIVEVYFAGSMREAVREEVDSEADVEEEVSELLALLGPEKRK